ncbi:hypothetical protein HN873_002899 [Arachis hypogaea]
MNDDLHGEATNFSENDLLEADLLEAINAKHGVEGGRTRVAASGVGVLVEGVAENMEVAGASSSIGERKREECWR